MKSGDDDALAEELGGDVESIILRAEQDASAMRESAERDCSRLLDDARAEARGIGDEAVEAIRAATAERISALVELRGAVDRARRSPWLARASRELADLSDALDERVDEIARVAPGAGAKAPASAVPGDADGEIRALRIDPAMPPAGSVNGRTQPPYFAGRRVRS